MIDLTHNSSYCDNLFYYSYQASTKVFIAWLYSFPLFCFVLSVHDTLAQKYYDPELPPLLETMMMMRKINEINQK